MLYSAGGDKPTTAGDVYGKPGRWIWLPQECEARYPVGGAPVVETESIVSQAAAPSSHSPVLQSVTIPQAPGPVTTPQPQFLQHSPNYDYVVPSEGADVGERGNTASYARVEVLKSGEGAARVEQLNTQPHVEFLAQHIRGELAVPGDGDRPPAVVQALMDSGSGVTSISESLVARMQRERPGEQLVQPFRGKARVRTAFGEERAVTYQTIPLLLTLLTPWGNVRFQLPFVVLPGDGDVLVLGQVTLREVLCVDVMADLKRTVMSLRSCVGESPVVAVQRGEAINQVEKQGQENGEQYVRTMFCGRLTVEAEEEQKDGEQQVGPTLCGRMAVVKEEEELGEGNTKQQSALERAVDEVERQGMPPDSMPRPRAWVPAQVTPMIGHRKPGTGSSRARPRIHSQNPRLDGGLSNHTRSRRRRGGRDVGNDAKVLCVARYGEYHVWRGTGQRSRPDAVLRRQRPPRYPPAGGQVSTPRAPSRIPCRGNRHDQKGAKGRRIPSSGTMDGTRREDVGAGFVGNGRGPGDVGAGTKQGKMRIPPGDCPPHPPPRKLRERFGFDM